MCSDGTGNYAAVLGELCQYLNLAKSLWQSFYEANDICIFSVDKACYNAHIYLKAPRYGAGLYSLLSK